MREPLCPIKPIVIIAAQVPSVHSHAAPLRDDAVRATAAIKHIKHVLAPNFMADALELSRSEDQHGKGGW